MEGRKLLVAHVFDGRQEIAKLSLQTLLFRGFLTFLFLFTILYMLGAKRHALLNKFLSQKRQPILLEERDIC